MKIFVHREDAVPYLAMELWSSSGMTRITMPASPSIMEAARVMVTSLTPWSSVRTDAERELDPEDL